MIRLFRVTFYDAVALDEATDEQLRFLETVQNSAVTDTMPSTTMRRLDIWSRSFLVGHRIRDWSPRGLVPGEEVTAVFGAWYPRTTKQPVPTRYRDVLVITDRRIMYVTNASPRGAVRSVAAGTPALERASAGLAAVASKVAGPSYWWVGEAWQAELEVGPVGVDTPMSAVGKLRYALGLLLVTAPRLRMKTMPDRTRLLWLRVLFSNPAVGTIVGGMLAWATIVFHAESGSAAAATFLTTAIPSAAWGVRWLRAHSTPPRRKGPRGDG